MAERALLIDPSDNPEPTTVFKAAIQLLNKGYKPHVVSDPTRVKTRIDGVPTFIVAGINSIIVPMVEAEVFETLASAGVKYVAVEGPAWIQTRQLKGYTVECAPDTHERLPAIVESLGFKLGPSACKISRSASQLIFHTSDAPEVNVEPLYFGGKSAITPTTLHHHITSGVDFRAMRVSRVHYGVAPAEVPMFIVDRQRVPVVTVHPKGFYVRIMSDEVLEEPAGVRLIGNILFFLLSEKKTLRI